MSAKAERVEIEEALEKLLARVSPIEETETLDIDEAVGRVCAEDIVAGRPVPSFPRSAMDGYAVRAEDLSEATGDNPVRLKVCGELLAGDYCEITYSPGSAVRVMTGAMVPEGYDAVVRQEDTDYGEDEVLIFQGVRQFTNYCHVGEELEEGELVLPKGSRIGRIEVSLLASLGLDKVKVIRPARIGIVSTGSELQEVGMEPEPGKIYDSIRHMLLASIRQEGLEVSYSESCADDEAVIKDALRKALAVSDMVLTTGGVSVGKKDLIPQILEEMGAERLFYRANIQPGTPTMGSVLDRKVVLSLSGNPYAALANFDYYFWQAVARLMGSDSYLTECLDAELADPYEKVNKSRRLVRARYAAGKVYLPEQAHMSSVVGNLRSCNCYMDLPAEAKVSVGDTVTVRMMK